MQLTGIIASRDIIASTFYHKRYRKDTLLTIEKLYGVEIKVIA